jgi:hypothetical protein
MTLAKLFAVSIAAFAFAACTSKPSGGSSFDLRSQDNQSILAVNDSNRISMLGKPTDLFLKGTAILSGRDTLVFINSQGMAVGKNQKPIAKIESNGALDFGSGKKMMWQNGVLELNAPNKLSITPNSEKFYQQASLLFLAYSFAVEDTTAAKLKPIPN